MSSLGSSQLDEVQLDPLSEAAVARAQLGLRTLGLKFERNQHGVRSSLREWSPMWNMGASLWSVNLQVFRKQGDGQAIWKLITVMVGWVLSKAHLGFPSGLVSKESACSAGSRETLVLSLGWEDPLEKRMATHSSVLAWRTPWTGEPGRLQSMGLQRVGHDWSDLARTWVQLPTTYASSN